MRNAFHDELEAVNNTLVDLGQRVAVSMAEATEALLNCDLELAEKVIKKDDEIDDIQHELDARTMAIIALQQPVAGDLRVLVTSLRMSADLERMGDMAHHIAKLARMRHPKCAVPDELKPVVKKLNEVVIRIIEKTSSVIAKHDVDLALELERDDDEIDQLHRQLFKILMDPSWKHGIEVAIDTTLLGRYYERCADHAVSVGRRIYYMVKGEYKSE